jgi:hypothetical protein
MPVIHSLRKRLREGSVGIATRYGLDGLGIESQWERSFPHKSKTGLGPTCTLGTGSFPGVKRPWRDVDHPPHIAPRLKKELSYTFPPPLGVHGLCHDEICFLPHPLQFVIY